MHDEETRRRKAHMLLTVLRHFLGVDSLDGLAVLDIGSRPATSPTSCRRLAGGRDQIVPGSGARSTT